MPVKLPFTIAACSGEDPECPARELLYHSQDSKGWCTPRHCTYPQELVLRLDAPARLTQIQLLCHESRIPARVEILVGLLPEGPPLAPPGDLAAASWKRLGFLSFDTNERTQYSARELKTVGMPGAPAHLVRFLFHRCHANALNPYGQAGLVALGLVGEPLPGAPLGGAAAGGLGLAAAPLAPITSAPPPLQYGFTPPGMFAPGAAAGAASNGGYLAGPPGQPPPFAAPPAGVQSAGGGGGGGHRGSASGSIDSSIAALAAELSVDLVTAERIRELQLQKAQAVEREDYDEAKRLKGGIDRLRAAGGKIAALEGRKRGAVEAEDYDLAKQLKAEIDRLRGRAYAAALAGESSGGEAGGALATAREPSSGGGAAHGGGGGSPAVLRTLPSPPQAAQPPAAAAQPAAQEQQPPAMTAADWAAYDDRPAVAKGTYDFSNAEATSSPPLPTRRRASVAGASMAGAGVAAAAVPAPAAAGGGPAPPPGFPADLPPPKGLGGEDSKSAGPLEELVGEYVARCAYSGHWPLREAALKYAAAQLAAPGGALAARLGADPEAFRTLGRLLARALPDKVVAVFSAALALLRALVDAAAGGGGCGAREGAAVAELLPVLVDKGADLNARIRESAVEALMHLLGVRELGVRSQAHHFLRPIEPSLTVKKVVARVQLVSSLLPVAGLAGKGGGEGLQAEAVMAFAGPCLSHSHNDVRAAAVALVLQLGALVGPSVQRMLPADLNPKLRETIQQGLLSGGAPPPAAGAAGAAAARPPARAASVAPRPAAAPPAKPAARAAGGAGSPGPAPLPGGPSPTAAAAAGGVGPGAVLLPTGDDDPAPYAAELAAREAHLGSRHPDVAEALSNLAIIHNQRGDTAAALPLYERALGIWEAAVGPDHPDVAHTLTDIAVIHLEQGRDDLGRPLLERALAIQEKHLGPDHPDVVAIRDVLQEEA